MSGLWDCVRITVICPKCVRGIATMLVGKDKVTEVGPFTCPHCAREEAVADDFHRAGEPDIVDIPRNNCNLTTVEAEYDRAMRAMKERTP